MPDIAAIASILTSIKTATDIAKFIKSSDVSIEKAETKMKLAELISALADAKIELAGITELIAEKDNIIRDLNASIEIKKNIKYEAPYYFIMSEDSKDGPYCQQCYDNDSKLIRLQSRMVGSWHCMTCKTHYTDKNYNPPSPQVRVKTKFGPFNY